MAELNTFKQYSVFISYAREDQDFVIVLKKKLEENKVECLGDWNLTAATDFQLKLKEDNLAATMFLFVISPDSIKSNECKKEIALAVENKKVILPISYREHEDDNLLDSAIRTPQWVFIQKPSQIESGIPEILKALKTDFQLMEIHSRLLLDVDEWVIKNKNSSYLLKKDKLKEAEEWLQKTAIQPNKLPQPNPRQIEYIVTSQRAKTKSTRISLAIAGGLAAIFLGIAIYAFIEQGKAITNEKIAKLNEETAKRHLKSFKLEQFQRNLRNADVLKRGHEETMALQEYLTAGSIATEYPNDSIIISKLKILTDNISAFKLENLKK